MAKRAKSRGEVSCQIFGSLTSHAVAHGFTLAELCEGTSIAPKDLENPKSYISWDEMLALLERLETIVGGPEAFEQYILDDVAHHSNDRFARIYRFTVTPAQLYRMFAWTQGFFVSHIETRAVIEKGGTCLVTQTATPPLVLTPIAIRTTGLVLAALPQAIGLSPATVEDLSSDGVGRFRLTLPPSPSLASTLRRSYEVFRGSQTAIEIMVEQHKALRDQNVELLAAKREAEEHLQRLEAEIALREETEAQLRHSQKLDAIGQMAGGVAHDFNNLLTVIIGNLELLSLELDNNEENRIMAKEALDAADLGASLTQRLLAFSRRQTLRPRGIELGKTVKDLSSLLKRTLGEAVDVQIVCHEPAWCTVDPSQFESAVVNLALNSRDAMVGGGTLEIEVTQREKDRATSHLSAGRYAEVSVKDTGCGMSDEILERAVEPFFTTKKGGRGTGLGLSTVYGFARQSGGHVLLESKEGSGTTVTLLLPWTDSGECDEEDADMSCDIPRGSGEHILVVEDEESVRKFAAAALNRLGYNAIEAPDAIEALSLLESEQEFDLLFTDIVLPKGMNGVELARKSTQMRDDLPLLFCSGYAADVLRDEKLPGPLLIKPYTIERVARAVYSLLRNG